MKKVEFTACSFILLNKLNFEKCSTAYGCQEICENGKPQTCLTLNSKHEQEKDVTLLHYVEAQ